MSEVTREQILSIQSAHRAVGDVYADEICAICTLALERLDMEPRPIADAPKDGTEIFAYWDDEWVKTYWVKRNGFEGWQLSSGRAIKAYAPETWRPTHFIPLSSPPKPKGE